MKTCTQIITPNLAQRYLEANSANRQLRRHKVVKAMAEAMKRGEWMLSPQGISFSTEGVLLDGQHRLHAIIESGIAVPMTVFTEVNPHVFAVLDRGTPRTLADVTRLPKRHVEILTFFHEINPAAIGKATAKQINQLHHIFGNQVIALSEKAPTSAKGFSQVGVRAAAVVLAKEGEADRAFEMYKRLTLSDFSGIPPIVSSMVRQVIKGKFLSSGTGGAGQIESFSKALFALDPKNEKKIKLMYSSELRDAAVSRALKFIHPENALEMVRACPLPPPQTIGYTSPAAPHCAAGFSDPPKHCDESRSYPHLVCGFCHPMPQVFGGSEGRAQALPVRVSVSRFANPFELPPSFGDGCVGFCKSKHKDINMFSTPAMPAPELPAAPHISVIDGQPTTTSLQVAQHFGKRHANVMRDIRDLLQELPADRRLNFELTFMDVAGPKGSTRQEPFYRITRDGFMLLAMGFTGPQALRWKLAYLDAFNAMADQLARLALNAATAAAPLPAPGAPQPSIDVRALMLTGQSAAKPVTPAHQALIDAHAWVMAGEAYEISRQHLARQIAYRASDTERVNPPNARITQIIKSTTLGQALAHTYHAEIQQITSVSRALARMGAQTYADMQAVADKLTNH